MGDKTYEMSNAGSSVPASQIGATMEALFSTIMQRKYASSDSESYTKKLLDGKLDDLLKKVSEESLESCLAAKECEMLEMQLANGPSKADEETGSGGHAANPSDALDATGDADSHAIADTMQHFTESMRLSQAAQESVRIQEKARLLEASIDHMRYEAADVIYHLLVLLARFDVPIDELAAELNMRMREDERPAGCVMLQQEHVRRGK